MFLVKNRTKEEGCPLKTWDKDKKSHIHIVFELALEYLHLTKIEWQELILIFFGRNASTSWGDCKRAWDERSNSEADSEVAQENADNIVFHYPLN